MTHEPIKTTKGTLLPLIDLKGKPYLQVAHRLVWFREEHKDWAIETTLVNSVQGAAMFQATIKDENGRVIATAHKMETKQGFADYLEKAETGAIGRALALCGYGTQFEPELDEGERLADSPVQRSTQPTVEFTNGNGPTEKQVYAIQKIQKELGMPVAPAVELNKLSKQAASDLIGELKAATEQPPLPTVPDEVDIDDIPF